MILNRCQAITSTHFWPSSICHISSPAVQGMRVDRMLGPPCDLELWPWPLDVQGQILKKPYLRNGRVTWHGMKEMRVDGMSNPLFVFEHCHWPWPWPWIFKVEFWNSCYSKMGRPIRIEWKGLEAIGSWTNYVTLNFDLTHDLDLVCILKVQFWNGRVDWHGTKGMGVDRMLGPYKYVTLTLRISRSNFEIALSHIWEGWSTWKKRDVSIGCLTDFVTLNLPCLRNGRVDWHGMNGMWMDRMLGPLFDLEHCIFKVKFWNGCTSGMVELIKMEWNGCESIGFWLHYVTLNFDLTHDLGIDFLDIQVQMWNSCISGIDCLSDQRKGYE